MTLQRAMNQAASKMSFNPLGHVHHHISAARMQDHRRYFAANSCLSDDRMYLGGWIVSYAAHRATVLAAPVTDVLDKVLGDGRVQSRLTGRNISRNGFQSDGILPAAIAKAAQGPAWIGCKVGSACAGRKGAQKGAWLGAILGASIGWVLNQGLALVNLFLKGKVLGVAILISMVLMATSDLHNLNDLRLMDALAYAPNALAEQVAARVRRLFG